MKIDSSYLSSFAKLFGRSLIQEFIREPEPREFHNLLRLSKALNESEVSRMTYKELFDKVYKTLTKRYRCEYIFKNTILCNEILSTNHENNVVFLNEVVVRNSKADVVAINGTTTLYEIKTGLDNLNRLDDQLTNYTKAFDIVNILTEESKLDEVQRFLKQNSYFDSRVGVLFLRKGRLETVKEAQSNFCDLDLSTMFSILRQKQIKDYFGAKKLQEAEAHFCSLDKMKAQEIFKQLLREKRNNLDYIKKLPKSLKMAGYSLQNLTKTDKLNWIEKLDQPILI